MSRSSPPFAACLAAPAGLWQNRRLSFVRTTNQVAGAKAPMETAMINTIIVPTDGSGHANVAGHGDGKRLAQGSALGRVCVSHGQVTGDERAPEGILGSRARDARWLPLSRAEDRGQRCAPMRGNWIEFACLLLTDLTGKNRDSLVELGLLTNCHLLSMAYGISRSCDGCRELSVYEPRELVVPGDPGLVFGLESVYGALGQGELDLREVFCGGVLMFHGGMIDVERIRVNPIVNTREENRAYRCVGDGTLWLPMFLITCRNNGSIGIVSASLRIAAIE